MGLRHNLAAQAYAQIAAVAVQVGTVPVLIAAWGVRDFGTWVVLTAIPTYLSFCDLGFTYVAKNDMTIRVAGGDRDGARLTYRAVRGLLVAVSATVALAAAACFAALPAAGLAGAPEAAQVLALQGMGVLAYQFQLLAGAALRAEGRAATETVLAASMRLAEAMAICLAALAGGGVLAAAGAALGARLGAMGLALVLVARVAPWLSGPPRLAPARDPARRRLAELAGPALHYLAYPLATGLFIQAPPILLGLLHGPVEAATYAAARTAARLGIAAANAVNFAFVPELSRSFGAGDMRRMALYLRRQMLVLGAGAVAFLALSPLVLPVAVRLLTQGQTQPPMLLLMALAAGVFAEIPWSGLFSALSAINRHQGFSRVLLALAAAAMAAGMLHATPVYLAGIVAAAQALALVAAVLLTRGLVGELPLRSPGRVAGNA
jgi:O-antigen/teichoic acid export membrane protein